MIQVGGVVQVAGVASGVDFDVEHLLGDNPAVAPPRQAGVLKGVFEIKEHPGCLLWIALVNQHRPALEQIAVVLQRQVEDGV